MEFTDFDIEMYDGHISFSIWKIQMTAVLTLQDLDEALGTKPSSMSVEDWEKLDKKALSRIRLCLSNEILREVHDKSTTFELLLKLEDLYMARCRVERIPLKMKLYSLSMDEGTPVQTHVDKFNSIIYNLKLIDVVIDDEDKAILLLSSLPSSYKDFKEFFLYINSGTLCFEDVKFKLLSNKKFNLKAGSSSLYCWFCNKLGHDVSKCYEKHPCKICDKFGHDGSRCYSRRGKGQGKQPHVGATSPQVRNSCDWILHLGCSYHMCANKSWFSSYEHVDSSFVRMCNDSKSKVEGVGDIQIKTHDGTIRTLSKVRHVPELKYNLISLGIIESKGYTITVQGGVLEVSKGTRVVLKGTKHDKQYTLLGSSLRGSTNN